MPGADRHTQRNPGRQSGRARRNAAAKDGKSSGRTSTPAPGDADISRLLSLSREERSQAVRELQRRYGNQRVNRMLARLVQPDADEATDPNQVSSDITDRIAAQQGSGQPLDTETRSEMENSFGQDFSDVKVHTGGEANSLNEDVQAKAFTTGSDIFFQGGNYSPGTSAGKELLAHELTHVVQQQGATPSGSGPDRVTSPNDASELEAAKVAESVVSQSGVARQAKEEELPVAAARQAEGEELPVAAARQAEEEELPVAAARQAEEEELPVAAARQAEEEELPVAAARQAEEEDEMALARAPDEDEMALARQGEIIARQPTENDVKADEDRWVALMETIAHVAEGKKPEQKSEYEEALKTTGKTLLETGVGKQLKQQAKEFLLSKKGMPLTLTLGAGTLAAMIATKTEVPSIPISLSENIELTIDVKGPLDKPEGVMATFTLKF